MRIGLSMNPVHSSPEEWADKLTALGLGTAHFPCNYQTPENVIDQYVQACKSHCISIGEVGAWCNPLSLDSAERVKNIEFCQKQLALADYVGARCCVNISGTCGGSQWDGPYPENYAPDAMKKAAESVRIILDQVNPVNTYYTLEPMPWMIPDSPEQFDELIHLVDHPRFAVHMDIVNMLNTPEKALLNRKFMDKSFSILQGKIKSCHVKDIQIGTKLTVHLQEAMCGDGMLDIKHYAELAAAEDPDMPFIIEHLPEWNAYMECLARVKKIVGAE